MSADLVLPELPFYWRVKQSPSHSLTEPPERLPFVFTHDPNLDLVMEARSPRLSSVLEDVYRRESNVGFLQDGHNLAKGYGEDFWHFLKDILARHPVRQVLELGCGGCLMLGRLQELGLDVLGVDPSPIAAAAGERKGVRVIQDFFPSAAIDMAADLIFHVDVLEHIEDPVSFLRSQHDYLRPGALLVVNVPDSSESIRRGDISMAMHQHVNMFSRSSLGITLQHAGFDVLLVEQSRYGASLYALATKPIADKGAERTAPAESFSRFRRLAEINIRRFQEAVSRPLDEGKQIGFFMPLRAFPYLSTMNLWENYRIFDNMNRWHHRYFDGFNQRIENQADLFDNPVDQLFVMSLTFGEEIRRTVREHAPSVHVTTLADLLATEA